MSEPSKVSGNVHSVKGQVVEQVGNVIGSDSWKQSGAKEHAEGDAEYKAAQAKGYAEGTKDRIGGKKDDIVGSLTGNDEKEAAGKARNAKGEIQQDVNK